MFAIGDPTGSSKGYSEYCRILDRVFAPISAKPRVAVDCDSASSLIRGGISH
jgi:hypothetical protein